MQVEALQMMPVQMTGESHLGETVQREEKPFSEFLSDSLGEVNGLIKESDRLNMELAAGRITDVSEVVIASEKAGIATQLTMQVRNRAIEAYQEIMRMQG